MNSVSLAFRHLARRPLQAVINALIMGLGLGMVTLLLLGQSQFEERMSRDARGIDLVVGAPGSPMQIILSSIYHVDIPTGNIPLDVRNDLLRDPVVDEVIPLALGDNHEGFRIVGTEHSYTTHYGARLREGRMFEETMEAVLGAEVARRTRMRPGDRFLGHHGLGTGGGLHGDRPYNVVGLLEYTGTVLDRLILTPVQSVWDVHDHGEYDHDHEHEGEHAHDEGHDHEHAHDHGHDDGHGHVDDHQHAEERQITALLVKYASPIGAARVPGGINENTPWQAAEPAFQTARLISMIEPALAGLRIFGALLILASLLGVFAVLYQNLRERRYDLAVMRAIGAGPGQVFRLTLLEGLLMIAVGLLTGLMLGHGATAALALWSHEGRAMGLTGLTWVPGQTWLVVGVLVAGCVTALIPSWSAARTEAAATLRRGH